MLSNQFSYILFVVVAFDHFSEGRFNTWEDVFGNPASRVIPLRHFGNKSYYMGVNHQASWFDAVDFCRAINMRLLSIRSKEEDEQIIEYITEENEGFEYWTGGTKLIDNVKWLWFPYAEEYGYKNWGKNQPDFPNLEKCMTYWKENGELRWNNRPCTTSYPFICERYDCENIRRY